MCLGHNYRTGNRKQELYHVLDEVTEGWSKCFLFSSLTSTPIIWDVPTPLLPPSSLLTPPGAFPQNPDFVFIYHALHANREEGFGLPPVQILILHHLSLERFPSRAEMPPRLHSELVQLPRATQPYGFTCITSTPPGWGWAAGIWCCINKIDP